MLLQRQKFISVRFTPQTSQTHTRLCSSLQKIQRISIFQKKRKKPNPEHKPLRFKNSNSSAFNLQTYKATEASQRLKCRGTGTFPPQTRVPASSISWLENLPLYQCWSHGVFCLSQKITLFSIFRDNKARLQLNTENSHLSSFAVSHSPEELPNTAFISSCLKFCIFNNNY